VVENRPGASGNIGLDAAAKSAPDGYTIFLGTSAPSRSTRRVFPKLGVTPTKDFIAVTQVVDVPRVLVIHPDVKANTVKDLVAIAKAYPAS
jgi:tripartite-type tricarboxylate transporter receptor subunit TctC